MEIEKEKTKPKVINRLREKTFQSDAAVCLFVACVALSCMDSIYIEDRGCCRQKVKSSPV